MNPINNITLRIHRSVLVALALGATTLSGQGFGDGMGRSMGGMIGGPASMVPTNMVGFGLYSVSGFAGYSTYPTFDPASSRAAASKYALAGGMAGMGYGKVLGERARLSIFYGPGVTVRPQDLERSRVFHTLGINFNQGITQRLSLTLGINGTYGEFDQFAFMPAQFSLVTSAPGTFDDLIGAITGGQFSNSQIASLLTGAPVLESAARSSIYGNRALTASGQLGLSYKISPRLTYGVRAGVNRFQSLGVKGDDLGRQAALQLSNGASGSMFLSYSITPRTSIGGNVTYSRTQSRIFRSGFVTYTGNVSHRLGERVFVSGSAGSGDTIGPTQQINYGARYIVNGSLAVQIANSQTAMVTVGRTFVDGFGLGLRSTRTVSGAWSYAPQGAQWSMSIYAGHQESSTGPTRGFNGYFTGIGANRSLTPSLGLSGQFFYAKTDNFLGPIFGPSSQGEFERSGFRLVVSWFPRVLQY